MCSSGTRQQNRASDAESPVPAGPSARPRPPAPAGMTAPRLLCLCLALCVASVLCLHRHVGKPRLRSSTLRLGAGKSRYLNEAERLQAENEDNYRKRNGALALKQKLAREGRASVAELVRARQAAGGEADNKQKQGALQPLDILKGSLSSASVGGRSAVPSQGGTGYGPLGTLSRAGPIPLFYRVFLSDQYAAAVDKFMLREGAGCSRDEAQANMDYYFRNPNDWIAMRKRQEASGVKLDLVNMNQDPTSLLLVAVWGTVSTFYIWRIYAFVVLGIDYRDNFWGF